MTKITGLMSAYLDLMRFVAAFAVLLGHMDQDGLYTDWFPLSRFSHEAVIVFFVMSGLIIYSTTIEQGRGAKDYAVARLSRIYSVALPAVIFCVGLAAVVSYLPIFDVTKLKDYRPASFWDIASSLLFLNESWYQRNVHLTMNAPYWSLCYEVWYYVMFGIFLFVRSSARWPLLASCALLTGPAILALLPIWALGAWLGSRQPWTASLPRNTAYLVYVGSLAVILLINASGIDHALRLYLHDRIPGFWRLAGSQRLLTDYIVGIAVAAHIYAVSSLGPRFQAIVMNIASTFKYLAGFSFTLYLFHRPLSKLWGFLYPNPEMSVLYSIAVALTITVICLAISYCTERQLRRWRALMARILSVRKPVPAA